MLRSTYHNFKDMCSCNLLVKLRRGPFKFHPSGKFKLLPSVTPVIEKSTISNDEGSKHKENEEKCQRIIDYAFGKGPYPASDITGFPDIHKEHIAKIFSTVDLDYEEATATNSLHTKPLKKNEIDQKQILVESEEQPSVILSEKQKQSTKKHTNDITGKNDMLFAKSNTPEKVSKLDIPTAKTATVPSKLIISEITSNEISEQELRTLPLSGEYKIKKKPYIRIPAKVLASKLKKQNKKLKFETALLKSYHLSQTKIKDPPEQELIQKVEKVDEIPLVEAPKKNIDNTKSNSVINRHSDRQIVKLENVKNASQKEPQLLLDIEKFSNPSNDSFDDGTIQMEMFIPGMAKNTKCSLYQAQKHLQCTEAIVSRHDTKDRLLNIEPVDEPKQDDWQPANRCDQFHLENQSGCDYIKRRVTLDSVPTQRAPMDHEGSCDRNQLENLSMHEYVHRTPMLTVDAVHTQHEPMNITGTTLNQSKISNDMILYKDTKDHDWGCDRNHLENQSRHDYRMNRMTFDSIPTQQAPMDHEETPVEETLVKTHSPLYQIGTTKMSLDKDAKDHGWDCDRNHLENLSKHDYRTHNVTIDSDPKLNAPMNYEWGCDRNHLENLSRHDYLHSVSNKEAVDLVHTQHAPMNYEWGCDRNHLENLSRHDYLHSVSNKEAVDLVHTQHAPMNYEWGCDRNHLENLSRHDYLHREAVDSVPTQHAPMNHEGGQQQPYIFDSNPSHPYSQWYNKSYWFHTNNFHIDEVPEKTLSTELIHSSDPLKIWNQIGQNPKNNTKPIIENEKDVESIPMDQKVQPKRITGKDTFLPSITLMENDITRDTSNSTIETKTKPQSNENQVETEPATKSKIHTSTEETPEEETLVKTDNQLYQIGTTKMSSDKDTKDHDWDCDRNHLKNLSKDDYRTHNVTIDSDPKQNAPMNYEWGCDRNHIENLSKHDYIHRIWNKEAVPTQNAPINYEWGCEQNHLKNLSRHDYLHRIWNKEAVDSVTTQHATMNHVGGQQQPNLSPMNYEWGCDRNHLENLSRHDYLHRIWTKVTDDSVPTQHALMNHEGAQQQPYLLNSNPSQPYSQWYNKSYWCNTNNFHIDEVPERKPSTELIHTHDPLKIWNQIGQNSKKNYLPLPKKETLKEKLGTSPQLDNIKQDNTKPVIEIKIDVESIPMDQQVQPKLITGRDTFLPSITLMEKDITRDTSNSTIETKTKTQSNENQVATEPATNTKIYTSTKETPKEEPLVKTDNQLYQIGTTQISKDGNQVAIERAKTSKIHTSIEETPKEETLVKTDNQLYQISKDENQVATEPATTSKIHTSTKETSREENLVKTDNPLYQIGTTQISKDEKRDGQISANIKEKSIISSDKSTYKILEINLLIKSSPIDKIPEKAPLSETLKAVRLKNRVQTLIEKSKVINSLLLASALEIKRNKGDKFASPPKSPKDPCEKICVPPADNPKPICPQGSPKTSKNHCDPCPPPPPCKPHRTAETKSKPKSKTYPCKLSPKSDPSKSKSGPCKTNPSKKPEGDPCKQSGPCKDTGLPKPKKTCCVSSVDRFVNKIGALVLEPKVASLGSWSGLVITWHSDHDLVKKSKFQIENEYVNLKMYDYDEYENVEMLMPAESIMLTRGFEPWIPIPCWPYPKKVKPDKNPCCDQKKGCPLRIPKDEGCNSKGFPCYEFPKRF